MLAVILAAAAFGISTQTASARSGTAAYAVDAYTGQVLYGQNIDEPRYPASLTKMMTLYVLFDNLKQGRLSLDSELNVSAHGAAQAPSKLGLKPGQTLKVRDAIYALVTKSANDAAATVAENLGGTEDNFGRMMTAKARSIGMTSSTFRNASGLPNPQQITTARDMVTLGVRLQRDFPEYYGYFQTKVFAYRGKGFRNHNRLLFDYRGTDGIKTGYTRASGFNLVSSVHRDNKHVVAVVLGGKTGRSRDAQMRAMLDRVFPKAIAYNGNKPWRPGASTAVASVAAPVKTAAAPAMPPHPVRNPVAAVTAQAKPAPSIAAASITGLPTRAKPAAKVVAAPAQPEAAQARPPAQIRVPTFATASLTPMFTTRKVVPAFAEQAQFLAPAQATREIVAPTRASTGASGYHVQVGAFVRPSDAESKLSVVRSQARDVLRNHPPLTVAFQQSGKEMYRARFANFSQDGAEKTCGQLKKLSVNCIVMRAE